MTVTRFLKNPKTETYNKLKELILSGDFPWYRVENTAFECQEGHEDFPFLSHKVLTRPFSKSLYSKQNSKHLDHFEHVFKEIAFHNEICPKVIYRINVNAVHPTEDNLPSPLHVDHDFPHNNMIIYLTDTHGGSTIVEDKEYNGKEDDILVFDGSIEHCAKPPSKNIRIVIVITFLS